MPGPSQTLNRGRYQIIGTIDQNTSGGMYEAVDTTTNDPVVLFECAGLSGHIATPSQIDAVNNAFRSGADALAALEHDCLVSVHDHFTEGGRQYLVLESLTGQDLAQYLGPDAVRPALREVLLWADQILNGLQYLHKLSPPVIHSDIAPETLKLTANLKVKLLTTRVTSAAAQRPKGEKEFTEDPAFAYRPLEELWPELNDVTQRVILNSFDEGSATLLQKPLDARSDLYSAAAVLYHVLTGQRPVDALERSIAILDGKPDPLQHICEIDPEIAPEISDAFMRALALRRENRFDSAMIMRQVLRTAVVRAQERMAGIPAPQPVLTMAPTPTTAEDPLELERLKAEEREREILEEQLRLEEEQKRIEKRKLELEAERAHQAAERERLAVEAELEQKRLAREKLELEARQERERVAQRLAEIEAERERERAEEERLELEAREEQRRAEERLENLKREQERHRAEQVRLELEAKQELELAEQRLKELSFDLEPVEPVEEQAEEVEPVYPSRQTPVVSPNPFEPEAISRPETQVPHFHEQPGIGLRVPAIIGGAVAMLAISVWISMTMFTTSTASQPATQQAAAPVAEQPQNTSEFQPVVESGVLAGDAQPAVEDPASSEIEVPADEAPVTRRRLQTAAVQAKPRRSASEKTPAKPKVTVDDLINDN